MIKCESRSRPDGARRGPIAFFDLLNGNKQSVALDLDTPRGLGLLDQLISEADIIVESARPRALAQMGIDAERCIRARPGQVWVSITGHGRHGERGHWGGFGDDAAVAAGAVVQTAGTPDICGDALAAPLTGQPAAVAALAHWRARRGALLDISLRAGVSLALARAGPDREVRVLARGAAWAVVDPCGEQPVAPPRARTVGRPAPALGAHTQQVRACLAQDDPARAAGGAS